MLMLIKDFFYLLGVVLVYKRKVCERRLAVSNAYGLAYRIFSSCIPLKFSLKVILFIYFLCKSLQSIRWVLMQP